MSSFKFDKGMQGSNFRVEVAYVAPPRVTLAPAQEGENPPTGDLLVGEPLMIETDVLGYPVGESVEFMIFEPFKLHESPIHSATGTTEEETRGVAIEWTYDHAANKDKVTSTRFVCVARVGTLTSISEPFEILEPFTHTLQNSDGKPLPNLRVKLRAPRRNDISAVSDSEGKIELNLPPADYLIEVLGPMKS